jgi:integration host factor subunit beta
VIKSELIMEVSETLNITKKQSAVIVKTIFYSIIEALAQGDKVEIRNFGSFRIKMREERIGRNPRTGEKVKVPQKKVPFFKPGKELKHLIEKQIDV